MLEIKVGHKKIGTNQPVFVIAEIGVNHNGQLQLAKKLIDRAKAAGADAVKFQNFLANNLVRKSAPKAAYQNRNIGSKKSQWQMLKELELSLQKTKTIKNYCERQKIIFLSTPYDLTSFDLLKKLNVGLFKLASIDVVFHPLIKKIAESGKPLLLSTGMSSESEIKAAVKIFNSASRKKNNLILLQCNTNYPARPQDQNLLAMTALKKYTPLVGFSDHTEGDEISLAAVALGAKVIERHFTLSKNMTGPDHKASLEPAELTRLIKKIRRVEAALGQTIKRPTGGEKINIKMMRRSICAAADIPKNTVIKEKHLAYKRPADGLLPIFQNINKILNKKAKSKIPADTSITLKMLKK
jgi:N-acetylneuraminate synthase